MSDRASDYVRIVDPLHADAIAKAEKLLKEAMPGQPFLLVIVDPPELQPRKASWCGTFIKADAGLICQEIANQCRAS